MATDAKNHDYIPTLDGWRAIAILGVLICHGTDALLYPNGPIPNPLLHQWTRKGALGVDVFFGISGFLIFSRLLQEYAGNSKISLKNFYIRRAFRILPPYLMYLGVVAFLTQRGLPLITWTEGLSCLLFLRNYFPLPDAWYTGHFWSLAVEEHFYLLLPGIFALLGKPRMLVFLCFGILSITAWRSFEFSHHWLGSFLPSLSGIDFYSRTDIRLDALLAGAWMAFLVTSNKMKQFFAKWLTPTLSHAALWFIWIFCIIVQPPAYLVWQSLLIPLLLVSTILHPQGLIGRILENPVMRWVGTISYSLYLWNNLFLVSASQKRPLPLGRIQEWPLNIFALFLCASFSYYILERPLRRWGRTLTAR